MIILTSLTLIALVISFTLCILSCIIDKEKNYNKIKNIFLGLIASNALLTLLNFITGDWFDGIIFLMCTGLWIFNYKTLENTDNDKIDSIGKKE